MRVEDFLGALKAAQEDVKTSIVERAVFGPQTDQLYARAVGKYEGLKHAETLLVQAWDEERRDKEL